MVDWSRYLESIAQDYAQWWQVYTLTDVVGPRQERGEVPLLDLGLMVETVERDKPESGEAKRTERLGVLDGLRKYAPEHVLLVGRPGSGKSTALVRLLLEEAEAVRSQFPTESDRSTGQRLRIPVLVELRYYQTSVLDLIGNFFKRHQVWLDRAQIETLLFQGQFLLLVDGLNELPSEASRRDMKVLRQNHPDVPMVFTTRDLGVGGDLDLQRKLEMQALTEAQMRQFVIQYLPEQGEQMLRQLGDRLREFGQTPLLLWMLCSVFDGNQGRIPISLGFVFRQFTQLYDRKLRDEVLVSPESRRWWTPLLRQLAWVMMQGDSPTEIQIAIPKAEAETVFAEFLQDKVAHPETTAVSWLEDLLKYHLIQLGAGDRIEFRHQLIQEYYAAEYLLKRLSTLSDEELKRQYLNYLKWTEPLVLMLELVTDAGQASSLIQSALSVDLKLGARLAGAVNQKFQKQTVQQINDLATTPQLKIELFNITRSKEVSPHLKRLLEHDDFAIYGDTIDALVQIGTEAIIPGLIQALEHQDFYVHWRVVDALAELRSEMAIPGLIKALEHQDSNVGKRAVIILARFRLEAAIPGLLKASEHQDSDIRSRAIDALIELQSKAIIPDLIKALEHQDLYIRSRASVALAKLGETAIPQLIEALEYQDYVVYYGAFNALIKLGEIAIPQLIEALEYQDAIYHSSRRRGVVNTLTELGEAAIPGLLNALEHPSHNIRSKAAIILAKLRSEAAIPELLIALEHPNPDVQNSSVDALTELGEAAIPGLLNALEHPSRDIRSRAAIALVKLRPEAAIPELLNALEHPSRDIRSRAAIILAKLRPEAAIPELLNALEDQDLFVQVRIVDSVRDRAVDALTELGEAAIPGLLKALEHPNSDIRSRAAIALAELRPEAAIPGLLNASEHPSRDIRSRAAIALAELRPEAAIPGLLNASEHPSRDIRSRAAIALAKLRPEAAIPELLNALEHEIFTSSNNAATALTRLGEAAIPELLKALEHSSFVVQDRAVDALIRLGEAAIPELLKALEHPSSDVRSRVVDALTRLGKAAIPGLLNALEHPSPDVRSRAAIALAKLYPEAAIPELLNALEHPSPDVRSKAVDALIKLGSESAIPGLLIALEDKDLNICRKVVEALREAPHVAASDLLIKVLRFRGREIRRVAVEAVGKIGMQADLTPLSQALIIKSLAEALNDRHASVRRAAAEALGKIGNPKPLALLWEQQRQSPYTETLTAISAIQERCQFYSYDLTQPPKTTPPKIPSASPPEIQHRPVASTRPMHILHLSDLHFGTSAQANLWSGQLSDDLRELNLSHLDALILSGDIANRSTPEEYAAAEQFLAEFRRDFSLKPEQIIIVPGNHDLNWTISEEEGYEPKLRKTYKGLTDENHAIDDGGNYIAVINPEQYQRRFQPFSQFYQAIKGEAYPIDPNQQYTIDRLNNDLLILGLNSAWQLDHHYKTRVSINDNALTNALRDINRTPDYQNCPIKIAVWHHPIHSAGDDRIRDSDFLERLAVNGFRFFLHGHIHQAQKGFYDYDSERGLFRICAGTFGASTDELTTATPWQYHLLKFADNQLTIQSRKRASATGAWESDYCWRYPKGERRDSYQIDLTSGTPQNPQ